MRITSESVRTFEGVLYSREELQRIFDLVASPKDWRAPILRVVDATVASPAGIRAAVQFFTATDPEVTLVQDQEGKAAFLVKATGYRFGPAGDH